MKVDCLSSINPDSTNLNLFAKSLAIISYMQYLNT